MYYTFHLHYLYLHFFIAINSLYQKMLKNRHKAVACNKESTKTIDKLDEHECSQKHSRLKQIHLMKLAFEI